MLHFFVTPFWIVCVHIFASFDTLFVCTFLGWKLCIKNTSTFCAPPIVHLKNTKNVLCVLKIAISKSSKKCYRLRFTNFGSGSGNAA